ncbi:MAG: hypothetical protein ACOC0K_01755 [bacterium]
MRRILYYTISALVIFIIGLVSPLTPSTGVPGPIDLLLFIVVPLLMPLVAYHISTTQTQKVISLATTLVIFMGAVFVLTAVYQW